MSANLIACDSECHPPSSGWGPGDPLGCGSVRNWRVWRFLLPHMGAKTPYNAALALSAPI